MRKRIRGTRGVTLVGPARMTFEVRGNELHYRRPFQGFVDVLEPSGDDVCPRARHVHGQGVRDVRAEERSRRRRQEELEQQLVKHIDEALAMENNVLRMLDGMIETTDDPEIKDALRSGTRRRPRAHATAWSSGSRRTASRRRWCARPAVSSAR